jgi:uncharacterized membrane protein
VVKEIAVLLAAATPIIEVRGSIPLGLYLGLSPATTFTLSIIGSFIPAMPLLWFLKFLTDKLRKIEVFDRFFSWLFARTSAKSKLIEEYETAGLALFIGVPLPGTGVWTGVVGAYLFGLSWSNTAIASLSGTAIASSLVLAASLGFIKLFS